MKFPFTFKNVTGSKGSTLTGFTLFVLVLCLLNLLINNINHRFFVSDFRVYYYAARNLLEGGSVYFISFGEESGLFKYSPLALLMFVPYTLFPFTLAAVIHFFILSFAYWYTFVQIRKLFSGYFFPGIKREQLLLSLAVLSTLIFLVKELYLGNINIILILLSLLALSACLSGKLTKGGILLGLVILIKPFFLILVLPLLFRKYFRAVSAMILMVFSGIIAPLVFLGFNTTITLTTDWIKTLMMHSSGFPSMNSINYLLHYYFFPGLKGPVEFIIILAAGILMTWFILTNLRIEKKFLGNEQLPLRDFIMEWFILLAMLPNIVNTDTEHFLASAPVIAFIIYTIARTRRYWLIPVMVTLIFFFGGNSQDALGKDLSYRLFSMGLIGLSNLLLIVLALLLFVDSRRKEHLT